MKTMKLSFVMAFFIAFSLMLVNVPAFAQHNKCQPQVQNDLQQQKTDDADEQLGVPACCPGFIKDLTPEQGKQIDALHQKFMKDVLSLKNLITEKKAHLVTVSTGDNADIAVINKTIDELYGLKAELAKKKEALKQDVRKLLNDEQKLMFDLHHSKGPGKGCGIKQGKGCDMGRNEGPRCGMQQGMGGQGCNMGQKQACCGMQQGMGEQGCTMGQKPACCGMNQQGMGQGCTMGQKQPGCGMQQGMGQGCTMGPKQPGCGMQQGQGKGCCKK